MVDIFEDGEESGTGARGAGAVAAASEIQGGAAQVAGDEFEGGPVADPDLPAPTDPGEVDDDPPPGASEGSGGGDDHPPWELSTEGIDPARVLFDRPDVFQGFFDAYYGPNNDHRSHAWADRVGEATPEAYALYWYKTYAFWEGYRPSSEESGHDPEKIRALLDPGAGERTTSDGVPLNQILADRPDVFQAFYREYFGPGVDHHSSAWDNRVGGGTPQDYANYWYEAYGKAQGYAPEVAASAPAEPPAAAPAADDGSGYFVT